MMSETRFLHYEGIEIEYILTRKDVKYVNLRVNKREQVVVSAPPQVPINDIENFLLSKAEWIINSLAKIEQIKQSYVKQKENESLQ